MHYLHGNDASKSPSIAVDIFWLHLHLHRVLPQLLQHQVLLLPLERQLLFEQPQPQLCRVALALLRLGREPRLPQPYRVDLLLVDVGGAQLLGTQGVLLAEGSLPRQRTAGESGVRT